MWPMLVCKGGRGALDSRFVNRYAVVSFVRKSKNLLKI